ncbi:MULTISPECIES: bile acid:sodium symporter family protein [unclassified Actinomyces]|uniref:bile acid:sodium symporter family protein n=1 Tax=unclassified Actinomyces TaxID=2609248 RepID=UPI001373DAF7|nr:MULTISPECIES: bile acid:sodium symporter family protein [unclassified Actinomyces]NDR53600.1 bile acid:sodium symporter family protein [Actinomyces sp. 565]QHO90167.1 Bile acid:sodium symporter [Actinomyces sp. 432]
MTPSAKDASTRPAPPTTDQLGLRRGGGNEADRADAQRGAAEHTEARRTGVEDARQERSARIAVTVFPLIMFAAFLAAFFSPSTFVPLSNYMTPLLAVTMLGMGMTLSVPDFTLIARRPVPVVVGVLSQFSVMPLVGWTVAHVVPLPDELKVGIILIGCVPGGTTSNVCSFLAKGNTALSVSMTALSTMLAPVVTPLLTLWLAGTYMEVPAGSMALSIVQIVLLPVGAGLLLNMFAHRQVARVQPIMPWVSVIAIAGVVAAVVSRSQALIATAGMLMFVAIAVENAIGYGLGYAVARLIGVSRRDRRTISIETGLQNAGLGSTLAAAYLGAAVAAPCAVATFWHTITGSVLAMYWRLRGFPEGEDPLATIRQLRERADVDD